MTTVHQGRDVHRRLGEFGLEIDDIHQALAYGHAEAAQCTDLDHVSYRGMTLYSRTGRRLHEILIPRGWEAQDHNGQMRIINPSGFTLIHGGGDASTADPSPQAVPRHANKKGPVTGEAVRENSQPPLFEHLFPEEKSRMAGLNWFLLYRNLTGRMLSELSFPEFASDGTMIAYRERIILPELDLDNDTVIPHDDDLDDRHDFEVQRRA